MTAIITRTNLISAVNRVVENEDTRRTAIAAINHAYIDEHTANIPDDNMSGFFNIVTHYDMLHELNPAHYNQQFITEEASHAFLR